MFNVHSTVKGWILQHKMVNKYWQRCKKNGEVMDERIMLIILNPVLLSPLIPKYYQLRIHITCFRMHSKQHRRRHCRKMV